MTKIAIIGAGHAGMTAATFLKNHADITIFDKARGMGGRMATRRASSFVFDHGAQYFTARTEPFKRFLTPLIETGLVVQWKAKYAKFNGNKLVEKRDWSKGEGRYVAVPGMNAMVKLLGAELNVKVNTRIVNLKRSGLWRLVDDQGCEWGDFDWVISAVPAPQAVGFLPEDFSKLDLVRTADMRPCFAVMLGFSQPICSDIDAAHFTNSSLSWVAAGSRKPGRTGGDTLTIHSSHEYAEAHITEDPDVIRDQLICDFEESTGTELPDLAHWSVHRWLYANNAEYKPLPLLLDHHLGLGVCGDWSRGGRVEGAFLSAHQLAEALLKILEPNAILPDRISDANQIESST